MSTLWPLACMNSGTSSSSASFADIVLHTTMSAPSTAGAAMLMIIAPAAAIPEKRILISVAANAQVLSYYPFVILRVSRQTLPVHQLCRRNAMSQNTQSQFRRPALAGLRVLDLSRVLAGPTCAQTLADLGADVVKIERPGVGDDTRPWGPPWLPDEKGEPTRDSTYFSSVNRNKRSIAIDLANDAGAALARRLAQQADVLIENYKVGDLARRGLDYAALSALNPRLVYCSITGFGQTGPLRERPGYDYIFQGVGGLMSATGLPDDEPGGGPMKIGVSIVDLSTGLYAGIAILAALRERDASGLGQYIDMALFDTVASLSVHQAAAYFQTGKAPVRAGTSSAGIMMPYETFKCVDGYLIVACGNNSQWRSLCAALARDDLAVDARL